MWPLFFLLNADKSSLSGVIVGKKVLLACAIAMSILIYLGMHFSKIPVYQENRMNMLEGRMLMTTPDSYYYLKLADDLQHGQYSQASRLGPALYPESPPLLAQLTVAVSDLSGFDIEQVAFYLPPILGALSILMLFCWVQGILNLGLVPSIVSVLALMGSFAFLRRSCIGYFDTDSFNLVLIWGLFTGIYFFSTSKGVYRVVSLIVFFLLSCLLYGWWPAVAFPIIGLCLGIYALSVFTTSLDFFYEKVAKVAILILGAVFSLFVLSGQDSFLPDVLSGIASSIRQHLGLVRGVSSTPFFNMGDTIIELSVPSFNSGVVDIAGSYFAFAAALCGLISLFLKRRELFLYLGLPALVFIGLSFTGQRFLMFIVPVFAIGCAGFYSLLSSYVNKFLNAPMKAAVFGLLVLVLLLIPGLGRTFAYMPIAAFDNNNVMLGKVVEEIAGPESTIWNWWGPGYMFQYYGKRHTIIDGGSQDPYNSYVSAVPFASTSAQLSRNWIKFFSVHHDGLKYINSYVHDYAKSVQFLINVFFSPENLGENIKKYNLPLDHDWKGYLFPEKDVFLVLMSDMLIRGTWLSIGRSLPGAEVKAEIPFYNLPFNACKVDVQKGEIQYGNHRLPYGLIFSVSPKQLSHSPGQNSDHVAIVIEETNNIFYMKREHFDCLVFRLLFVYPADTPYFKKVVYNPFVGGIWKVE